MRTVAYLGLRAAVVIGCIGGFYSKCRLKQLL